MPNIPHINYKELDEFYTIQQLCKLLDFTKQGLKEKCEQYGVKPRRNEIGDYGLVKYDVRKLHNSLYHEGRDRGNEKRTQKEDDPWA